MRCLIDARVLTDPNPGGVTRVASALINKIIEINQNDSFTLITTGIKKPPAPPTHYLPTPLAGGLLSYSHLFIPNKLLALATSTGFTSLDRLTKNHDVLFLPNLEMVSTPKIPYALLIHDLSFLIEPTWFSLKGRLWHIVTRAKSLIRNADVIFAVSTHTKQDLINHLGIEQKKIRVLPLGNTQISDTNEPLPPHLQNTRYFLALGTNDPRKNLTCITTAFQELLKNPTFSHTKLVLIGTPPLHSQYSIPDTRYYFLPRPSDALLSALMKNATALLYPSWYEGYGLPLHEAAIHKTPIIASTSGALPETAPPGTLFVPPFKPHLWTQAMRSILETPKQSHPSTPQQTWDEAARIVSSTLQSLAN